MTDHWERMWSAGLKRGAAFDCDGPSATLTGWISRQAPGSGAGKRALVPGAGRSYDAVALSELGYAVCAWDIAPTAVVEARALVAECDEPAMAAHVSVEERDFFAAPPPGGGFDLVWDCTFLCALPKAQRGAWAAQHANLVRPGGRLISCVFPMFPAGHAMAAGGPPFPLDVPLVRGLLEPHGFRVGEEVNPLPEGEQHMRRGVMSNVGSALLVFTKEEAIGGQLDGGGESPVSGGGGGSGGGGAALDRVDLDAEGAAGLWGAAMRRTGFATVTGGHNVDGAALRALHDAARAFFELAPEGKQQARMVGMAKSAVFGGPPGRWGWKQLQRDGGDGVQLELLSLKNDGADIVMASQPALEAAVAAVWPSVVTALRKVMSTSAVALGKPAGFYDDAYATPEVTLRCAYYPADGSGEGPVRYGEHVDFSAFTMVADVMNIGGLQVREPQSGAEWQDCSREEGAIHVNAGTVMERISGGEFVPCVHRVAAGPTGRLSLVFFTRPDPEHPLGQSASSDDITGAGAVPAGGGIVVAVGSQNPIKLGAVRAVLARYDEHAHSVVVGHDVPSGVADQPMTMEATTAGARHRAEGAAAAAGPGCQLSLGIESGLFTIGGDLYDVCATAAYNPATKIHRLGFSCAFMIPARVAKHVLEQGMDLSQATNAAGLTNDPKLGSGQGLIGILSRGKIYRLEYTKQSVLCALVALEEEFYA